ncbi:hypothetical protein BpHYR1_047542 [Brachionus plicatilis]|uniref:Uncharacterized protein n=1 Tax=Brachionus plicatilis TaxID=10195 RepID=A0A3M7PN61_BRAPC|nr:hypothetical protein BpHYR1_047542 [Brachionus plicatilis]
MNFIRCIYRERIRDTKRDTVKNSQDFNNPWIGFTSKNFFISNETIISPMKNRNKILYKKKKNKDQSYTYIVAFFAKGPTHLINE